MGTQQVDELDGEEKLQAFTKALLDDVRALEMMLHTDLFEIDERRIGAEQEMFLVDDALHPAPKSLEVLDRIDDPRVVTELARFNLEINLAPATLTGSCLSSLHHELDECLATVRRAARLEGARVLLAGILPTLHLGDLQMANMTPLPRYQLLNKTIAKMRGGPFRCQIKGIDELDISTDSVMLEAANTSFQVHLQVSPREFAPMYNVSQAIAGPVLAAAVNSPLLLGRRLWSESRVALFQHSVDARSLGQQVRGHRPRVDFGSAWVKNSVLEIFQEDIARFRVVLSTDITENSLEVLSKGLPPRLQALCLHNGTVYRWNRPCYGHSNGRAHLRIEARALPSGPSSIDEIANAAFFFGLMTSVGHEYGDVTQKMDFDEAKGNFFAAARHGLDAQFAWPGYGTVPAPVLILEHLLPLSRAGLESAGVDARDIDTYLGVLEDRVKTGRTGSRWMLASLANIGNEGSMDQRCRAITAAALDNQAAGQPVHTWDLVSRINADWRSSYRSVGQCMSTDLLTVRPWDLVDLAASLMDWEKIRHVPVEDDDGRLVGVISHRSLLRLVAQGSGSENPRRLTVDVIMKKDPLTVNPETPTLEAIHLMRSHKVGCLPVVRNEKLVGIITEHDFIRVAGALLEERLQES